MQIEQAWRLASRQIQSDSAILDAQLLLLAVLQKADRSYLLTWPDKPLSLQQEAAYQSLLKRRLQGEPIAHILGYREFWGLNLKVNASTLIPRPDTETLVACTLALISQTPQKNGVLLDLGTGTGAIALALKSELPDWEIDAVEFNAEAAELARENSKALKLPINIYQGSWFKPLASQTYHFIVSNPPYIDADDPHLSQGDVRFEPKSALVAHEHGLADFIQIAREARSYLKCKGYLLFEHGYSQSDQVQQILQEAGYTDIASHRDLAGQARVTVGQLKK
ncbi:peptide chain release factor N(5)-glutamine methyltransferase [Gayadomonas joobiniege]|uniref:peptide chain release factor N(5)-glutamine methyltransferase n=1 Tax=Gayadomonas joobiniege TaxID=1234606 RepID=UPI00035CDE58|nr:peptide chain release factor N(5)-glutamine methyltransferase [Gayadomonas joobiniege]